MFAEYAVRFSFESLWTPRIMILLIILMLGYLFITGRFRHHFKNSEPVIFRHKLSMFLGLTAVYLGLGSPFYIIGHFMFTFHMIQMACLYLIAPPLLLIGMPEWFFQPILNRPKLKKAMKIFIHPVIGLVLFNSLFSFYHMPFIFDTIMTNVFLHTGYQIVLFLTAVSLWFVLIAPVPELNMMSNLKKIGMIIASAVLLTPACGLIIFADSSLYGTYSDPDIWRSVMSYCVPPGVPLPDSLFKNSGLTVMPTLYDQQTGGVLMKIMQEIVLGTTLAYVFFQWVKQDKQNKPEEEYEGYVNGLNPEHQ